MNRNMMRLISLLAILTLFSIWAFGQATSGLIEGTVTDKTGAVVPGAAITVTSINTGALRTSTTGSAGEYAVTNLKPDTYNVTIEKQGFVKYTRQITVQVGSKSELSAQLAVTGTSTTVEVTASGEVATVNTETQTLSTVVTSKQILALPTLTRNPYDLVATSGNVVEDPTGNGRGGGYEINGQRGSGTNILLDGGENSNMFDTTVGQSVPLDTVQEFSVLTNNYTAEYGGASGGIVNVATKSGTNAFHGSAYEFNRVSALAANTYQNDADRANAFINGDCVVGSPCSIGKKSGFTRNQFGYTIGGPIIKNKLFFFNGTEWTRVRSNGAIAAGIIDPAFLSLPQISPNTTAFFSTIGKPLVSSAQVLSKINWGQATNGVCPLGIACSAPFGESISWTNPADAGGGVPQNTYSTVAKIDYNISDKTTLTGRYALYSEDQFTGSWTYSPYQGYSTGQTFYNQGVNINLTHVFSPNFVSSTKLNYNRLNNKQPLSTNPVAPTLYTSGSIPALPGTTGSLVFPGYNAFTPGNAVPFGGPQNVYEIYEDISWTKGKHQFKFGGSLLQLRDNRQFGAYENPIELLGTSFVGNSKLPGGAYGNYQSALYNLVVGNVYRFQGAVYPQGKYPCNRDQSGNELPDSSGSFAYCTLQLPVGPPRFGRNNIGNDGSFYVQDSWKVSPRLTLNLGLRWEYYGVQHNSNPNLDSNFYLGAGSNLYEQFRNGSVQLAPKSPIGGLWAKDYDNWAPRVGFAWDIFGDGSTSLRGGYGIGYERNFGNVTFNVIQNPPNYAVTSLQASTSTTYPIYTTVSGPLSGTGTKLLPAVNLRAVNPNISTAYSQFWDVAVDRQIMRNSVFSIDYAGSKGTNLYSIADMNVSGYGAIFLGNSDPSARLNYQYNEINFRGGYGFNNYNAVNLKFSTSNFMNKGLQLTANYTWSHAIDNLSSTFTDGYASNYQLGFTNGFAPQVDKGNSDYNVTNRIVVSGVWDLPWMKNASNAFARQALGGWSMSPIFVVRSGYDYTIFDCTNAVAYSCARYIAGVPYASSGSNHGSTGSNIFTYLPLPQDPSTGLPAGTGVANPNPTCSGLLGVGCVYSSNGGSMPERNAYQGPGYWNIDFVAAKMFKLTERFNLQFRGEFYNIFNHHNLYISTNNLDVSGGLPAVQAEKGGIYGVGGQPTDERRNIQFGLKLLF
jgi:outer membrane receptor protein involved in Fe transport